MSRRHNPERRAWKGRSYRKGGRRVRAIREALATKLKEPVMQIRSTSYQEWSRASNPHADVEAEIRALDQKVSGIFEEQSAKRQAAEAELAKAQAKIATLDAVVRPHADRSAGLKAQLKRRRRITLAPWKIDRQYQWWNGSRFVAGRDETWESHCVWLRVCMRDKRSPNWQWEVQINGLDNTESVTIVFGPPTTNPAIDFVNHAREVDDKLRSMGYFLIQEQSLCLK
jgi:hypothetical protein